MSKLTIKQLNFVLKLHEVGNRSEAYRYAYDTGDMNSKTINEEASRLAKDPKVTARLKRLQADRIARTGITVDKLANELSYIAFGSIADLFNSDNKLIPISQMNRKQKAILKKVKHTITDEDGAAILQEIEAQDKLSALDKLAKFIGFYELDNVQQRDQIKSDEENEALYQKLMADQKAKQEALKGRGERIEKEVVNPKRY